MLVLSPGDGEKSGGLWGTKVLLSCRMTNVGSIESQEHAVLQYLELPRETDTLNETLECVWVG